jgi:hypothetical protein
MIELACPEACTYLQSARDSVENREQEFRAREAAARGNVLPEVTERMLPTLITIETGILNAKRGINGTAIDDIVDAEILAAVENVIRNYRIEESGLIYEQTAASPRIEAVGRRIRAALDDLVERYAAEFRPRRAEILQTLERVRETIESHMKRGEGERSYLRFISLFSPYPEEAAGPRIII